MSELVQETSAGIPQEATPSSPSRTLLSLGQPPKVSVRLLEELQVKEVAQAIVFLKPSTLPATAGSALVTASTGLATAGTAIAAASSFDTQAAQIEQYFVKDDRSWSAALARSDVSTLVGPDYSALSLSAPLRASGRRAARAHPEVPRKKHEAGPLRFPELGVVLGDLHSNGLEALSQNENVEYVASSLTVSLIRPLHVAAAQPPTQTTWGITALDVDRLWAENYDGRGIRVGHVDTGVDGSHPALRSAVKAFLLTDDGGFPVTGAPIQDTGVHGTHTAGTIAGRPVAGRSIGVAPGAELYCAAVIEGGNVVARILAGLNWVVQNGVKIISMSLGVRGYHDDFYPLMKALRDRGVLPVVAVGNEGPGTSRSPGNYDLVLSVGACDPSGKVAPFSSSDTFTLPVPRQVPDVVGPGVGVISAKVGGGYLSMDGTSMATPHIAGLAACLWSAKLNATADQIQQAIFQSCTPTPDGRVRGGRGLPNAIRALSILTGEQLAQAPKVGHLARRKSTAVKAHAKKAKRSAPARSKSVRKKGHRKTRP